VAAVVKEGGRPEALTDLTKAELDESRDNVIELSDILDMHNFLKDFDGDFSRLFGPE
jgi:hypothetical protein